MLWLYNIGIAAYGMLLRIVSLFNNKAKQFVSGRENIFEQLREKVDPNEKPIWFHFASLGEFEQGRPVLEKLKVLHPDQQIVITFFSPSGYEIRKNYELAKVFYLPLDSVANAEKFISLVNPRIAIFTKYEFWYHYFNVLHKQKIPLYMISGIFRPGQLFFKWYGGLYRKILKSVSHFFVQNQQSMVLLTDIGITNVSLSGDTRFDRVYENARDPKQLPAIVAFCGNSKVLIAGSTWPADEELIPPLVKKYDDWKFIIAPHEVDEAHIQKIERLFPTESIRYSKLSEKAETETKLPRVLIIDSIGILSSLYQYGDIAYIGGGFGVGIHNTLEAAAFGLPIIFGPNYDKFQEAKDLIIIGSARSISNKDSLMNAFDFYIDNKKAGDAAKNYVEKKKGATDLIIKAINF